MTSASVTRRCGRSVPGGKRNGTAIIEMIGLIPLFIAFILMTLLVCRWLVNQGRILAASRTVAWLVAHSEEEGENEVAKTISGSPFAKELRDWHFIDSGKNAGVVVVQAPVYRDGLFGSGRAETLMKVLGTSASSNPDVQLETTETQTSEAHSSTIYQSDSGSIRDEESSALKANKDALSEEKSSNAQVDNMFASFMQGVVDFLSRDFKRCEVRVDYWMPLLFPMSAFERLLGRPVDRGDGQNAPNAEFAAMGGHQGEYALLSLGRHTTCVLPMLEPGRSGGVAEAMDAAVEAIDKMLETMKQALAGTRDSELYRPMVKTLNGNDPFAGVSSQDQSGASDDADAVLQKEFYALMVYEWTDPLHKQAKSDFFAP